jgi:hypothetical protein
MCRFGFRELRRASLWRADASDPLLATCQEERIAVNGLLSVASANQRPHDLLAIIRDSRNLATQLSGFREGR